MGLRTKAFYIDAKNIEEIIAKCDVCYVGMTDTDLMPYVVPFNFGYKDGCIYLHSAQEGKKIDILRSNPQVCIAFSTDHVLAWQHEDVACSYLMKYRSVQVFGRVEFITDYDEKIAGMNLVMQKYTGRDFPYNAPSIHEVSVYKVVIEKMYGKSLGY